MFMALGWCGADGWWPDNKSASPQVGSASSPKTPFHQTNCLGPQRPPTTSFSFLPSSLADPLTLQLGTLLSLSMTALRPLPPGDVVPSLSSPLSC